MKTIIPIIILDARGTSTMKHKEMVELMGKKVIVSSVWNRRNTGRHSDHTKRGLVRWEKKEVKSRAGWIVGFTYLQTGRVVYGYGGEDPTIFKQTDKPVLAVKVVYWPTMKPVFAPLDGCSLDDNAEPYFDSYRWTDRDRELMSKDVKMYAKRDDKGRFTK